MTHPLSSPDVILAPFSEEDINQFKLFGNEKIGPNWAAILGAGDWLSKSSHGLVKGLYSREGTYEFPVYTWNLLNHNDERELAVTFKDPKTNAGFRRYARMRDPVTGINLRIKKMMQYLRGDIFRNVLTTPIYVVALQEVSGEMVEDIKKFVDLYMHPRPHILSTLFDVVSYSSGHSQQGHQPAQQVLKKKEERRVFLISPDFNIQGFRSFRLYVQPKPFTVEQVNCLESDRVSVQRSSSRKAKLLLCGRDQKQAVIANRAYKQALLVQVELQGGFLHFVNLHINWLADPSMVCQFLKRIGSFVQSGATPKAPVVMMGDWNRGHSELCRLLSDPSCNPWPEGYSLNSPWTETFSFKMGKHIPSNAIDYFVVFGGPSPSDCRKDAPSSLAALEDPEREKRLPKSKE